MINSKLSIPSQSSKRDVTLVLSSNLLGVIIGFCDLKTVLTLTILKKMFCTIFKDNTRFPLLNELFK